VNAPTLAERFAQVLKEAPRIKSLSHFDAKVSEAHDSFGEGRPRRPRVWFRGHRDARWPLTPLGLRQPSPIPDAVPADEIAEQRLAANAESDPLAASLLQESEDAPLASSVDPDDLQSIPPVLSARPSGFEPLTYGSGGW